VESSSQLSPLNLFRRTHALKIAAILPAYNESERVADVVRAVQQAPSIDEIVVVNDGSTDNTSEVLSALCDICVVNLPVNCGKGGAMVAGAAATDADVLVFLDADLIGLTRAHVEALVAPVREGRAEMAVGRFRGGRRLTDWSQRIAPNISGQRVILRSVFEQVPDIAQTRYGVEMAITRFCRYYRVPTETVYLPGVTHPMKEEKLGLLRGWASRGRMYLQILRILLDPRAPRPARARIPRLLRRIAANQRRQGHLHSASYWLYKQEMKWRKRHGRMKTKV
jgi:glycosyltransferase involved in cell wall biosynthesis